MRRALVIGMDYNDPKFSGCKHDAERVADIISKHENGAPNFHVKLKSNIKKQSELRKNITELFEGAHDATLLYYSGFGSINDLGKYIAAPDFKEEAEGMAVDDIVSLANNSRSQDNVIILDCRYTGPNANGRSGSVPALEGTSVLSTFWKVKSVDQLENQSIFTTLLVAALQGEAADFSGYISIGGIYACIDQALGAWEQRPIFETHVSRFTYIQKVVPQVSANVIRELVNYFPNPDENYGLDPSYEFKNHPDELPILKEPIANPEHIPIFKNLQKMVGIGLVKPVGEEHMYFAAMNSKSCQLTELGKRYWRLVKEGKI